LELLSVRDNKITINRTDVTGSRRGLTATYVGTLHDGLVGGEYSSSYEGHSERGNWYWVIEKDPVNLPDEMHFCAANCITLRLQTAQGMEPAKYVSVTKYAWESSDYSSTWVVESFTPASVVLRRTDTGSFALTVVYRGRMSAEDNTLVGATVDGNPAPANLRLAWGTALNSVPPDNCVRDRKDCSQVQPITLQQVGQAIEIFHDGLEALVYLRSLLQ
jgi:hypothetical protein